MYGGSAHWIVQFVNLPSLHEYCPVHMQSVIIPLDMELQTCMDVWTVKPKNIHRQYSCRLGKLMNVV